MLQDSAARMQKVQSLSMVMHMDLNLTSSGLSLLIPMDVTGDVAAPDKSHIQSKLSILGQNFSVERIQVGDKAYVRQSPTDPWALEGQSTVSLPFNPQSFMLFGPGAADFVTPADLKQTFQSVTLVGEESVDGVATQHFTGILPAMNLGPDFATATTNLSVDIWVGKEDRLIRKMTMNGILPMTQPIPGSPATLPQSGTLNVSMNATFSRYNQPVAIELPVVAVQPTTTPVVR